MPWNFDESKDISSDAKLVSLLLASMLSCPLVLAS